MVDDMPQESSQQREATTDHNAPPDDRSDPSFKALGDHLAQMMERLQVPGVALGILHDSQEYVAGFGVTSIEHPLPITADTLFQIGSITKTFTGTAIMRLIEQGKLDLDAPLHTYLPSLRLVDEDVAKRVTMRHLLTHTGGWFGDYFNDFGAGDDALSKMVDKVAELPQVLPLGALYSYNNAGFYLAGRTIEVIVGQPFEAVIQELVLAPLGMTHSFFFPGDVLTRRFAVGHNIADNKPEVARPWDIGRAAYPAGGLNSTVHDLLGYARFHLGDGTTRDGTRLLRPESMAMMQGPLVRTGDQGRAVGLTWHIQDVDGTRIIGHTGGTNGQITTLDFVPHRNFALIVLTNANRGGELIRDVRKLALREYLGIDDQDPAPVEMAEELIQAYIGRYSLPHGDIEITRRDGGLSMQMIEKGGFPTPDSPPGPPIPRMAVALYNRDCIIVLDGPLKGTRCEFLRNEAGDIAWLRASGRVHVRQPA